MHQRIYVYSKWRLLSLYKYIHREPLLCQRRIQKWILSYYLSYLFQCSYIFRFSPPFLSLPSHSFRLQLFLHVSLLLSTYLLTSIYSSIIHWDIYCFLPRVSCSSIVPLMMILSSLLCGVECVSTHPYRILPLLLLTTL